MGSRVQKIAFLVFALMFVAIMAIMNTSILTMGTSANSQLTSTISTTDSSLNVYDQNKVFGSTVIDCAKDVKEVGGTIEHVFVVTSANKAGVDYTSLPKLLVKAPQSEAAAGTETPAYAQAKAGAYQICKAYDAQVTADGNQVNRTTKFNSYLCYNVNGVCTGVLFVQQGAEIDLEASAGKLGLTLKNAEITNVAGLGAPKTTSPST